jgi:hypothetical protein
MTSVALATPPADDDSDDEQQYDWASMPQWAKVFIESFKVNGTIATACKSTVGFTKTGRPVTRSGVDKARRNNPAFRKAFDDALEDAIDLLQQTALSEAINNKNTALLMFTLRGLRDQFNPARRLDVRGQIGHAVTFDVIQQARDQLTSRFLKDDTAPQLDTDPQGITIVEGTARDATEQGT